MPWLHEATQSVMAQNALTESMTVKTGFYPVSCIKTIFNNFLNDIKK
jgi:hypothetical protein